MRRIAQPITSVAEYKLPASISREIGRLIVRFSYLESYISRISWAMLDLDAGEGRTAVRDPRIDGKIDMIADLAHLKKIKLPDLKTFKTNCSEASSIRDLLSHGLWAKLPNGVWLLQKTRGTYAKDIQGISHSKRHIEPEAIQVTLVGLQRSVSSLDNLIADAQELRKLVQEQLKASRGKSA